MKSSFWDERDCWNHVGSLKKQEIDKLRRGGMSTYLLSSFCFVNIFKIILNVWSFLEIPGCFVQVCERENLFSQITEVLFFTLSGQATLLHFSKCMKS